MKPHRITIGPHGVVLDGIPVTITNTGPHIESIGHDLHVVNLPVMAHTVELEGDRHIYKRFTARGKTLAAAWARGKLTPADVEFLHLSGAPMSAAAWEVASRGDLTVQDLVTFWAKELSDD